MFENRHFMPFYASLWWLTTRDRRLAVACDVGFPSLKPGALTALKWWQLEKSSFAQYVHILPYPCQIALFLPVTVVYRR